MSGQRIFSESSCSLIWGGGVGRCLYETDADVGATAILSHEQKTRITRSMETVEISRPRKRVDDIWIQRQIISAELLRKGLEILLSTNFYRREFHGTKFIKILKHKHMDPCQSHQAIHPNPIAAKMTPDEELSEHI